MKYLLLLLLAPGLTYAKIVVSPEDIHFICDPPTTNVDASPITLMLQYEFEMNGVPQPLVPQCSYTASLSEGNHSVRVRVIDAHNDFSDFSEPFTFVLSPNEIHIPPNAPGIPQFSASGPLTILLRPARAITRR